MLDLYTYTHCAFCEKVRRAFDEMGVKYREINAERGTEGSKLLLQLGGKQQVPFLVDLEQGGPICMYESDNIIAYVRERFAKN